MSRHSQAVVIAVVLGACGGQPASRPSPLANRAAPDDAPASPRAPSADCAAPASDAHPVDLDHDPTTREVAVEYQCPSPMRCSYQLYAERDGCWKALGTIGEIMSEPGCDWEHPSPKGEYCTLRGTRMMIHGEGYGYKFPYVNGYGSEYDTGEHTEPRHHP